MIWKTLGFQAAVIAAIAALIAFFAPWPGGHEPAPHPSVSADPVVQTPAQSPDRPSNTVTPEPESSPVTVERSYSGQETMSAPVWSGGPMHDAQENAEHHWQKHGGEFSELHSARDYVDKARDFVNHPPPGAEIKHDSRGNTLIYDRQSNTFAVQAPNGAAHHVPARQRQPLLGSPALTAHRKHACPVCRHHTLSERGAYEICSVCGWEDDPAQSTDPDLAGGANRESLNRAREIWQRQPR